MTGQHAGREGDPRLAGFVERLAATLADAGFPRLPARVFASLLVSESGALTAAELAERLQASAGSISSGVRYLAHLRLIHVERQPGTRRHRYVVDSSWYESTLTANPFLDKGDQVLRDGIALLGDSPAAARLEETRELISFLRAETEAMVRRWHQRRRGPQASADTP